jgi:hypothetical protein
MKNSFVLLFLLLSIGSCTVAPVVDSNWISLNCSKVYYTPTECGETYSNCTCNNVTKKNTCTYANGDKYIGFLKGNNFHGKGDYYWESGTSFKGVWKDDKQWCGIEKKGTSYALIKDGNATWGEEGVDWGLVAGAAIVGAAAYAIADSSSSSGYGGDSYSSSSSSNCTYTHNFKEYTIKNPNIWAGDCPLFNTYEEPEMCSAYLYHSRECDIGKACGDTCISDYKTCHIGKGSACNTSYKSYP